MKKKNVFKKMMESSNKTHKIYHKFCDYFKRWYFTESTEIKWDENHNIIKTQKLIKHFDPSKMVGYEAMCRVEKYIKRNPKISIVYCDDDVFATSCIVLIPHPKMGITCIFIPQCTSVSNTFFLYPNHYKNLIKTLTNIYSNDISTHSTISTISTIKNNRKGKL